MSDTLPPISGIRTHKCQGGVHEKCSGAWFSFTREARVACGCVCHVPPALFDLEGDAA